MTIADMLGRVAPAPAEQTDSDAAAGTQTGSIVPSRTPALLEEYVTFCQTLERLAADAATLSERQGGVRPGADETPDALMCALEGLEALWKRSKSFAPEIQAFKAGGFGDFALQAMALSDGVFSSAEVQTGLR